MTAFTCKSWPLEGRRTVELKGERSKPESAQHIITFPGGSIEVSRTSDGDYWAHIAVNPEPATDCGIPIASRQGVISDSRIDFTHDEWSNRVGTDKPCIPSIEGGEKIQHLAVKISTNKD